MHLYHISYDEGCWFNDDTKVLYPRVPKNRYVDEKRGEIEDNTTERICMSPSILGCANAVYDCHGFGIYAVYEADVSDNKCIKPTIKQVPDCEMTGEVWVLDRTTVFLKYYINVWEDNCKIKYEVIDLDS